MGAICGGVMSVQMLRAGIKTHGAYFGMMAFVMPDKQYKRWLIYKKNNNDKIAKKIFDKYAISQI